MRVGVAPIDGGLTRAGPTMRCAVYYSNTDIRVEERPVPSIGPGEVLVKTEACGLCGGEAMEWYLKPRAPKILGHEPAGTIVEVGDDVSGWRSVIASSCTTTCSAATAETASAVRPRTVAPTPRRTSIPAGSPITSECRLRTCRSC